MRITRESPPAGAHTDDFALPLLAQTGPPQVRRRTTYLVDQAGCNLVHDRLRDPTVASPTSHHGTDALGEPFKILLQLAVENRPKVERRTCLPLEPKALRISRVH